MNFCTCAEACPNLEDLKIGDHSSVSIYNLPSFIMACACCNHGSLQLQYRPSSIDYNEYNTNEYCYKRLRAFESFDTLQYEVVVDSDR